MAGNNIYEFLRTLTPINAIVFSPRLADGGSSPSLPLKRKCMQIEISKTDYKSMMTLIDKAVGIIKSDTRKPREYNVARQLGILKRKVEKRNNSINL